MGEGSGDHAFGEGRFASNGTRAALYFAGFAAPAHEPCGAAWLVRREQAHPACSTKRTWTVCTLCMGLSRSAAVVLQPLCSGTGGAHLGGVDCNASSGLGSAAVRPL